MTLDQMAETGIEIWLPVSAGLLVFFLVLFGERLHARRCERVMRLAAGPPGRLRAWVRWVGPVRALALGTMAWALATLWFFSGGVFGDESRGSTGEQPAHRIVFLADLSPSMRLRDAGPEAAQTRAERISAVVDGVLARLRGNVSYTVIVFYTQALPVVADARDAGLVRNAFDGLPLWYVMESGKTDLGAALRQALPTVAGLPEDGCTLFVCTDGDTVPLGEVPRVPAAVRGVYVLGVGNPHRGTFIDGHMSRQNVSLLRSVAGRLGGQYFDVNEKHVSTLSLGELAEAGRPAGAGWSLTEIAIAAFAVCATLVAAVPVMLELFGADWKVVRVRRAPAPGGPRD